MPFLSKAIGVPRSMFRLFFAAAITLCCIYGFLLYRQPLYTPPPLRIGDQAWRQVAPPHPIDDLIKEARTKFNETLATRSTTLEQAAAKYRERRGRHPPPGYKEWFEYATKTKAIVVESFFDRIHQDLGPFWALDPKTMRKQAYTQPQLIRVRQGKAEFITDNPHRPPWIQHWHAFVAEFSEHLPDLDMVLNIMDETRLLVPWPKIDEYMKEEAKKRTLVDPSLVVSSYSGLGDIDGDASLAATPYEHSWITNDANRFWDHLRDACPPGTPAKGYGALGNFAEPVEYPLNVSEAYTYKGFISNITAARDPCMQPHMRGMHGTFIESVSMSTSHDLFPMFAGCKLPQNNEILIPGAMYLTKDAFYSGGSYHGSDWADKEEELVWRGTASGGRHKATSWWHFHRHRWVQMTNGTSLKAWKDSLTLFTPTYELPPIANLSLAYPNLGERLKAPGVELWSWVKSFTNTGFVDLECFPQQFDEAGKRILTCDYTSGSMAVVPSVPMKEQYDRKYIPDVDGNSYSARWRSFLMSNCLPLKATIYVEWHDDRLVPWVHYVPFDNSYLDLYAVMDYFLPSRHGSAFSDAYSRDSIAKAIADAGQQWANSVLRREDMHLYVWLLLLEYARIVDDKRDVLGYVGDLQ